MLWVALRLERHRFFTRSRWQTCPGLIYTSWCRPTRSDRGWLSPNLTTFGHRTSLTTPTLLLLTSLPVTSILERQFYSTSVSQTIPPLKTIGSVLSGSCAAPVCTLPVPCLHEASLTSHQGISTASSGWRTLYESTKLIGTIPLPFSDFKITLHNSSPLSSHQENDTCFDFGVMGVWILANAFFGFFGLPLMALRSSAVQL
jgi:hypothetical protein